MGRRVAKPLTARALSEAIQATLIGDGDVVIQSVSSLDRAQAGDLTFLSDIKYVEAAQSCEASVIILRDGALADSRATRLLHASPHLAFAQALDLLFAAEPSPLTVSAQAVVAACAVVEKVRIEAFACVGQRSRIGEGSSIHAGAVIGSDVRIGRDCVIHANATIHEGTQIGDRCIIHSGATIGADGFGFQPTRAGWRKVAQVGGVVIGDDVEVGANTCIDRGAIEDTIIGNGVKIDNLVQIAHNCRIGDNTAIAGCAGLAGSSIVGARCMIGGAAMIAGHLTICDDVVISGGTLVSGSIDQPGRYTAVFPIASHRDWMKIASGLRRSIK